MADSTGLPDTEPDSAPPEIDVTKAHPARMYDYFLGGKDNFAADRAVAAQVLDSWGSVRTAVRENRAFLGRAVRYLAREAGISQFLDIGTGLPSANNVHEVAQAVNPEARVVYADNDPIVLTHARALLASGPKGVTTYLDADIRDPKAILSDPVTRETLDFSRPIGLILVAVLHFLPDEDEPRRIVQTLVDALPSGSYLVACPGRAARTARAACGARSATPRCSPTWPSPDCTWSTPEWCWCRSGARSGMPSGRWRRRSTPTAEWPASPDQGPGSSGRRS
jgi:S-adenosyl methyltransferase